MIELVRDYRAINVLAKFENDLWKFIDVRALTVIFHVRSWKRRKKIAKIVFWRLWQNSELILINMFRPTYVPNLVTLAWKMTSGRSKEAGSLNGRLCAYFMRQNLHDRTCPRPFGNKCPCQVWKWSVKNCGHESVNGLVCPPARLLGRRQYPGALKGCGVKRMAYATLIVIWIIYLCLETSTKVSDEPFHASLHGFMDLFFCETICFLQTSSMTSMAVSAARRKCHFTQTCWPVWLPSHMLFPMQNGTLILNVLHVIVKLTEKCRRKMLCKIQNKYLTWCLVYN